MFRILKKLLKRGLDLLRRRPEKVPVYIPVFQCDLLKGRRAFITGGSRGIGYAIAEAFLRAGAEVVISGRDKEKLTEAVKILSSIGSISFAELDNTKTDAFSQVLDEIQPFDILVNNAGYVGGGTFGCTEESEYDKVLDTNLKGGYFLSQEVSRRWIKLGVKGNILNVCSASSLRPGDSPYILSKWGMRALTIGMAKRLIKYNIVVNGLAPGCTDTELFSQGGDLANARNPTGRLVTRVEVANLAVVMVSSLSRMVVGDVLYVTGGGAITTFDD